MRFFHLKINWIQFKTYLKEENCMKTKNINTYNIKGHFKNKGEIINFSRNIRSLTESDAKQEIYIHFGSKHKIKR
ncbi:MAG: 50S ribosomal protein L18Ae, partial [Candidatus Heimdallarchaeota archaeon]